MLLLTLLDHLGTSAFAVSGAVKAVRGEMDVFGLAVHGLVRRQWGRTTGATCTLDCGDGCA
ncbi:MAG: TRIC cation channel family protein [Armatimonadetes bacterium]|nr:TRIC cation channel family protein [Armatimonadota bacterium]